ncbi:MAG: hypothetical protein IT583_06515, partial [Verrucomicrobia bacterium]|nr:hypothetical protein [Verrucomicrobiota bacterium]
MKKFLFCFSLFLIGRISFADQTVFMKVRELPVSGKLSADLARTLWVADGKARIDYQNGGKTTVIHFPDAWYYGSDSNEGSYVRDNASEFRFGPFAYNERLKQLRYGGELEFMRENGFTNFPEKVDGTLCDVWESFADGFLVTLYVKQTLGVPFQMELRRDDSSPELIRKIRYDEYEAGAPTKDIFSVPSNIIWSSQSIPPRVFTNSTVLTKWLLGYYKKPQPDQVSDALACMNYYQTEREGAVALLFFLFQKHPDRAAEWVKQTEVSRTWLRQACLEALWLIDAPQGRLYLQQIADDSKHRDFKYVTEVLQKKTPYKFLDLPLAERNSPDLLMAGFCITGDPAYVQRLVSAMEGLQDKNSSGYSTALTATKLLAMLTVTDPSVCQIIRAASSGLSPEMQKVAIAFEAMSGQFYEARDIPKDSPLSTAESNRLEAEFWTRGLVQLWGGDPGQEARNLIAEYSLNFARCIPARQFALVEQNKKLDAQIKEKLLLFPENPALLYM